MRTFRVIRVLKLIFTTFQRVHSLAQQVDEAGVGFNQFAQVVYLMAGMRGGKWLFARMAIQLFQQRHGREAKRPGYLSQSGEGEFSFTTFYLAIRTGGQVQLLRQLLLREIALQAKQLQPVSDGFLPVRHCAVRLVLPGGVAIVAEEDGIFPAFASAFTCHAYP